MRVITQTQTQAHEGGVLPYPLWVFFAGTRDFICSRTKSRDFLCSSTTARDFYSNIITKKIV